MRESRAFDSTFEDDESADALSDSYDERYIPPSFTARGRQFSPELTRSRSQSLATSRPGAIGSQIQGLSAGGWSAEPSSLSSNALNIPGSRYGDFNPPGSSRHGSLGTSGGSLSNNIHSSSPGGHSLGNGHRHPADISNISPFVRDVSQILLDDGSAFRDLWAGTHPPRDENASGTTSRRHSVSVVQPRRGNIVGFNAPGNDLPEEPGPPNVFAQSAAFGGGRLMLSDDDLAGDLGMLNLNAKDGTPSSSVHPPSQPSSLPIYTPHSRSPPNADRLTPYQSINLTIPGGSFSARGQSLRSPSDSGLSGGSPPRNHYDEPGSFINSSSLQQGQNQALTARFIPGQGIQYVPQQPRQANNGSYNRTSYSGSLSSPISPTRLPQQQGFYSQSVHQPQRRPSDAAPLNDLGKGVPLHSVPASWPLYIVEFKAGRTDLFYLTDLGLDVRVGDLVIVEADRGKDLGKVVNDSITVKEVDEFQRAQQAREGFGGDQPMSPGGGGGAKKEINPKMIYGKAQHQDTQ
jgi:hypothetical protein